MPEPQPKPTRDAQPTGRRRIWWRHGPVPVLGLTGTVGAGKSAVAGMLAGHGATVLDADAVGHALLQQRPARERVAHRFGPEVLGPPAEPGGPPTVDRAALGKLVFGDPRALRDLEGILHPAMRRTFEKAIGRANRLRKAPALVLDAAILLEAGWDDLCDLVICVDAPAEARQARLAASRGWSAEALAAREAAQWPAEKKLARADRTIANAGTEEDLRAEVDRLWSDLRAGALARPTPRGRAPATRGQPPGDRRP